MKTSHQAPPSAERRHLLMTGLAGALTSAAPVSAQASNAPTKTLRYAFSTGETGFDPVQISDLYSRTVTPHIFEALYEYDPLARPYKIRPATAAAMPEVSGDFTVWTVRMTPGIYFADDAAFKGRRRELIAADYVYSFKRFYDPATKSPAYSTLKEEGITGLEALRQRALDAKQPFDYDLAVEGLQVVDRYTLRFRLEAPRPRFLYTLAVGDLFGAVAREVVEAYGDSIMEHPVGTGPFRLAYWRRRSLIVLERNPAFRERLYAAEPVAGDADAQAIVERFAGRRLPIIDRVEISIIDEGQPRWLAFLQGQHDLLQVLPPEFAGLAVPNGQLAPYLAKRGIGMQRRVNCDAYLTVYNLEDPVIGGYAPEQIALRRALNLAYDAKREIMVARRGQAVPAQSPVPPDTFGYDPAQRSENGDFDLARAHALLDLYGYVDRDGDGWRERPDGSPLVLELATPPEQIYRELAQVRKLGTDALGVRLVVRISNWAEQLKAARAGRFMIWLVGSTASTPDGQGALERSYGPAAGGANLARFKLPAFDDVYERLKTVPDGPPRQALFDDAKRIITAYAPYKATVHRIVTDLTQPWLVGYRRPVFTLQFWQYVDVDTAMQQRRST